MEKQFTLSQIWKHQMFWWKCPSGLGRHKWRLSYLESGRITPHFEAIFISTIITTMTRGSQWPKVTKTCFLFMAHSDESQKVGRELCSMCHSHGWEHFHPTVCHPYCLSQLLELAGWWEVKGEHGWLHEMFYGLARKVISHCH